MRRAHIRQSLIAGLLVLAMVVSITGIFAASGANVRITAPRAGAKVSGVLQVNAAVKNAGKVAYVILGVDENRPFSSNAAPFTFEIDTTALSDGAHRVFVEAYDNYGLVATSKVITVYVKNGSAPAPMVQARKAPATRVAAKPKPAAPVAKATPASPTAKAVQPSPATRVAGGSSAGAVTVDALADARSTSATAPTLSGRGPLPEPSHSTQVARMSPARPSAAETGARMSFASGAASDLPPAVRSAEGRVRGHTLVMNGQPVQFSVGPFIESGRMKVGFRGMFQHMGAKITWQRHARVARSVKGSHTIEVAVGSNLAKVNGKTVDMGTAASIRESRMMIPLRFFAQVTGAALNWDHSTKVANLKVDNRALAERPSGE
jgi:hypothetical protein